MEAGRFEIPTADKGSAWFRLFTTGEQSMSTGEMTKRITEASPRPLRLWPGIIAIVLLFLSRFAVKAVDPRL